MRKLALVLGGGAAKGFAHIGILKVLEKNGIVPDLIVGTSMGALVGGVYATGTKVETIEEMAMKFNKIGNFSIISALFRDTILNINNAKKIIEQNCVKECAVAKIELNGNEFIGCLYASEKEIGRDVKENLKSKLLVYEIPRFFLRCDDLPKTQNGKISTREVQACLKEYISQE